MARTAIPTLATGDLITAAQANAWWRDNEQYYQDWKALDAYASTDPMTGSVTLTDASVMRQFFNPNGTTRNVTLPAAAATNHPFIIYDTEPYGSSSVNLVIRDATPTNICILRPGQSRVFVSNGTNWRPVGGGYDEYYIPALDWSPTSVNGCNAYAQYAKTSVNIPAYGFPDSATKYATAGFYVPINANILETTWYAAIDWSEEAGTGDVRWQLQALQLADGAAIDGSYLTAGTVVDTAGAVDLMRHTARFAFTVALGNENFTSLRISRTPTHADDTLANVISLFGVRLWVPVW